MLDNRTTTPLTERDWEEDMKHENGNNMNVCRACKKTFIGHKRRLICHKCAKGHHGKD